MGLLDRVTSVVTTPQPRRVYLFAAEKWGKTSFAAFADRPIFLMTSGETGLLDLISSGQLGPVPHFPDDCKTWSDLLAAVQAVVDEPHDFGTLVIDTANGAERLLADHVLANEFRGLMGGKNGYGSYGKGDQACIPHWAAFLRDLDRLRSKRRMSIVLLAHSRVKAVNNPEGDDYDQLRPEGLDKLWPLTHKWASVIAAGTYRVVVKDDKAAGGRDRVIRLRGTAAVVAGNRYGLPDEIDASRGPADAWRTFDKAIAVAMSKGQSPITKEQFAALLAKKGKTWAGALAGWDSAKGTKYVEQKASFDKVAPEHIAGYAGWLEKQPDAAAAPASPPVQAPAPSPPPPPPPVRQTPADDDRGDAWEPEPDEYPLPVDDEPEPTPAPVSPPPPAAPVVGKDLADRILEAMKTADLDWPTLRDGADPVATGLPEECGYRSRPDLKLADLTPEQATKLYAWVGRKANEKLARKRNKPKPEGAAAP